MLPGCGDPGGPAELPQRTPGLWEIRVTPPSRPPRRARPVVTHECTAPEVDAQMLLAIAPGHEGCALPDVRRAGAEWRVQSSCEVHGNRIDTRFTLAGDFVHGYAGTFVVRYPDACPPASPDCRDEKEFRARYLGECPADLRPGEMRLPNGIVVHVAHPAGEAHADPSFVPDP